MSPLEAKLRRLCASLDVSALEALASKGLLRRAHKDLERGVEIRVTGQTETALQLLVGEFQIKLPDSGPATATCSCPAAGVCQHILTATLFLQQDCQGNAEEPLANPMAGEEELMAITPEQLEQWAGKAAYKTGLKLAAQYTPEIVRDRNIRIRFTTLNSEVHHAAGAGLDGMIVSGGKTDGRSLVIAAVVGFQRAAGKVWDLGPDASVLEASSGSPRTRDEVLESCQALLNETLANGLSRLSNANQQRWATLAVSAVGVNLPRLALLLRGVGDEASLALARDAGSDLARMLTRMAQTHALCCAIQNGGDAPRPDLVGLHRTRYDEVGQLDLIGAAAWPWRTASGYEGLTLLFWDPSAKRWNSWSDSRPRQQLAGFNPVSRFTQPGPWEGAESPRQLARNSFRLMNARRNAHGRLSGSSKSRALVTGPVGIETHGVTALADWAQLCQQLHSCAHIGLKEANPLDSIFALKPARWLSKSFDAVTQIFTWALADSQHRVLLMEVAFDAFTEPAIKFLEGVAPDALPGSLIIGRVQRTPRGVTLHPFSLHRPNGEVVHLCLDQAKVAAPKPAATQSEEEDVFEPEEEADSAGEFSPIIARLLNEVDDALLALAEAGFASVNPLRTERIRQLIVRTERVGLAGLTPGLREVVVHPQPSSALRCCYLSQLHRRGMPLVSAVSQNQPRRVE